MHAYIHKYILITSLSAGVPGTEYWAIDPAVLAPGPWLVLGPLGSDCFIGLRV